MVEGKTIYEMKAQAPCSLEDTTGLGSVNPIGFEENNPPLDLRIDIAFKVIFGEKVFMIDLLNSILDRTEEITDITYQPTESVPAYVNGKKVVFDLKCTFSTGEIIIVEMQYASQSYFKERALHNKFTDKLRMIFLELPFMKRWEDCDTKLKEWLYLINNSKDMDKIPFTNDRPIYQQLAEKARYASLTPAEQELYDYDLRNYMAYVDSMLYAEDRGIAKGRAEGKAEGIAEGKLLIAQNLKALGIDIQTIQKSTGLTVEEINNL